jgi:hypothetical protein
MAYAWVLDEAMRTSMDVALGVVTFLDGEDEIKEEIAILDADEMTEA